MTNKSKTKRLFYDSQDSAAGALEIPIEVIRQAKRDGCEAFRSGRVYVGPLMKWLAKHRDEKKDGRDGHFAAIADERALRLRALQLDLDRKEFELQRLKDRTLPLAQFEYCLQRMCTALLAALNALPGRVAPLLEGLDFHDRKRKLEEEVEIVKRTIRAKDYLPVPDPTLE